MSKVNPLAGLIGYDDSDESDDDVHLSAASKAASRAMYTSNHISTSSNSTAAIHPAPILHCPWSACYDDTSGFTYYWNQQTNAVTWEAPPEYLLALKLAQQQLNNAGSTEVSAEEWQMYQQALAEKQQSKTSKYPAASGIKSANNSSNSSLDIKPGKRKQSTKDYEEEKIELITSYHNSDSDSNDEESPMKPSSNKTAATPIARNPAKSKNPYKKQKTKPEAVEYGPSLPPNQSYTVPIGPELPPNLAVDKTEDVSENKKDNEDKKDVKSENEDSQDELDLLKQLKDKAKLLEKLGGELPTELKKMIKEEDKGSPISKSDENSKEILDTNIDDLLEEIEKKELPKAKNKRVDIFGEESNLSEKSLSGKNSPQSRDKTPPKDDVKCLFPSSQNIEEKTSLFPSAANIEESASSSTPERKTDTPPLVVEKKGANLYMMSATELLENTNKKKLRISNSVLPDRGKSEIPSYTTKYSQCIEGFTNERTGLGFNKDPETEESPKSTLSYGNGLVFTKGETLNEGKTEDGIDDLTELVEMKLTYLNELQPCVVSPLKEMLIQMQTLVSAFRAGALSLSYFNRRLRAADESLTTLETTAAPQGWTCTFIRSEQRYKYRRDTDGLEQFEYPADSHTDMDISTTPPHPSQEEKEESAPPLPPSPPPQSPSPPPPPAWRDLPPPGCEPPPLPPAIPQKQDISDELQSFYNDIAQIDKTIPQEANSPESVPPEPPSISSIRHSEEKEDKSKDKEKDGKVKKKSKVKISASMGLKHKTVSNLVAKWQQVAEQIHSD